MRKLSSISSLQLFLKDVKYTKKSRLCWYAYPLLLTVSYELIKTSYRDVLFKFSIDALNNATRDMKTVYTSCTSVS